MLVIDEIELLDDGLDIAEPWIKVRVCLLYTSVFYIIFEYLQEKVRLPMEEEADMQVFLEKQKSEAERAKD